MIVCGCQRNHGFSLKIRKAFWRRWHCPLMSGPFGETENGDGREKRGMKVEMAILLVHWPSPPGSHHSHASWTRMLQSQYLPVPLQNPSTGDWWELVDKHPSTLSLRWRQLWSGFYTVSQGSPVESNLAARNGNLLNNVPFITFHPPWLSYWCFLDHLP